MPNQSVGLDGKFNLGRFTSGLNQYLAGLAQIRNETIKTAQVLNSFGLGATARFNTTGAAMKNLGQSAQQGFGNTAKQLHYLDQALRRGNVSIAAAQGGMHGLSVAGIAVGTAIGQTAVRGLEAFLSVATNVASQGLEMVVFFERLGLAINFFAARSAQQADSTLSFDAALRQTADSARGLLLWVQQLAITSPLTTQQVGNIFRVSQAYGLLAEEAQVLLPLLLDLGAATGLDPQTLENAARALGQIRSRGKLTGEEIRQLGNAGIPIRDILVKELQITNEEFDKILESGGLVSDFVIPAIVDSLRDFEGAAEKVANETIGGLLSQLEEIKQIGLAEFFAGLLKPLQPLLKQITDFATADEFRAGLRVLGEEMAEFAKTAIGAVSEAVKNLISLWQGLDPVLRRNIVSFFLVGTAVAAAAAALGLVFIATQALLNPFNLIVAALTASIFAWGKWGDSVLDVVSVVTRGIGSAFDTIISFFEAIIDTLIGGSELQDTGGFAQMGEGAGDAWATGFANGATRGAARAINALGSFISGEMKPGSYPKFLQDAGMQGSGEAVGTEFTGEIVTGVENSGFGKFLADNMTGIMDDAALIAGRGGVKAASEFYGAWELPSQTELVDFVKPAVDAIGADNSPVVEAAYQAGITTGQAWVDGFRSLIPIPGDIVNEEIQKIIGQIGGGRELTRSGAEAFTKFLDGFKEGDFGVLSDAASQVDKYLSSLVDIGDIPEIEVPRIIFDVRESIAKAIKEFRDFGKISEGAFAGVKKAAEPLGEEVVQILRLYEEYAIKTDELTQAQEELNAITRKYDELLDPLYKKLRQVSGERQTAEEARELAELQRIVNSKIVTDERKRIAAAKIQEILTNQQIRNLEAQRDEEKGIADEKVKGAKEAQDETKSALELFQAQVDAQNDQLALVANEAKQIERLQSQLEKLREKELSVLDRQLKFLGLVEQEITDSKNAAKAKFTLESETSSEYEKQNATLDLQQIALQRINREAEALKLGFSPDELKKYRDLVFSLDDLGIKGEGAGSPLGEGFAIDPADLPDVKALEAEFNATLENVRGKIAEIKGEILGFLTDLNDRLPNFLKFMGLGEDEEVPLIRTLKRLAIGTIIFGGALKAVDLGTKFIVIAKALGIVSGALGLFATKLGITALLSSLGGAIAALAVPLAVLLSGLIVFSVAWQTNWLGMREAVFRFATGIKDDILSIGPFLSGLKDAFIDTFTKPFSAEGREQIRQEWAALRSQITSQEGRQQFLDSLKKEGSDYADNIRAGIAQSGNIVSGTLLGTLRQTRDEILGDPVANDIGLVTVRGIADGLAEGGDPFADFLSSSLETFDEIKSGDALSSAGASIGSDFASGITVGLNDQIAATQEEAAKYVNELYATMEESAEIKSPSERSRREVGIPIAEGIAEGIGSVDQTTAVQSAVDQILEKFDDLRNKGAQKFDALRTTLSTKQTSLRTTLVSATKATNEALLTEYQSLVDDTNEEFAALFADLLQGWTDLGTNSVIQVQNSTDTIIQEFQSISAGVFEGEYGLNQLKLDIVQLFTDMNTDVGTEAGAVRDTIVGVFVTDDNSVVNQLQASLLGANPTGVASSTSPTYSIGQSIMLGIAAGISGNQLEVSSALRNSLAFAFGDAATAIAANSPSLVAANMIGLPISEGVAAGIMAGSSAITGSLQAVLQSGFLSSLDSFIGSNSSAATPSYVSNVNRTTNYNLNVSSAVPSQGLIGDFAILQSMAGV